MNDFVRITKQKSSYTFNGKSIWSINAGGFHVYPTLNEAKTHIIEEHEISKAIGITELYKFVILKCIIPKDTKYYDGKIDCHETYYSYASKSLKITDEIMLI